MTRSKTFQHARQSVCLARHFAREALRGIPANVIQTAELMVSELASNCILHTNSSFDLKIRRSADEIRIEATDGGRGEPVLRSPGPSDASGRGLQIIDMLASAWGIDPLREGGKTVWFRLAAAAPAPVEGAAA